MFFTMDFLEDKPETAAALTHLMKLLRCAKCTAIPLKNVYMPFKCEHKYCESCATKNHNKCFVCNSDYVGCIVDAVFTNFLEKLNPANWGKDMSAVTVHNGLNSPMDSEKENVESEEEQESISSDDIVYSDDELDKMDIDSVQPLCRRMSWSSQTHTATGKTHIPASPETKSSQETNNEVINNNGVMESDAQGNTADDKPQPPSNLAFEPSSLVLHQTKATHQRNLGGNKQLKEIFGMDSEDDDDAQVSDTQFVAEVQSTVAGEMEEFAGELEDNQFEKEGLLLKTPSQSDVNSMQKGSPHQEKAPAAPMDSSDKPETCCRDVLSPTTVAYESSACRNSDQQSKQLVKPRKFFNSRDQALNPVDKKRASTRSKQSKKLEETEDDSDPELECREPAVESAKPSSVGQPPKQRFDSETEDLKTNTRRTRLSVSSRNKSLYIESGDEQEQEDFKVARQVTKRPNTIKTTDASAKAELRGRKRNVSVSSNGSLNDSSRSHTPRGRQSRNPKGETQLHVAARTGNAKKIRILLDEGLDVNAKDFADWTPLHEAISSKHADLSIVKLLCEAGADVNAFGGDEMTPLHEAVRLGLADIVEFLLSQNASLALRNGEGKLPRELATEDIAEIFDSYVATSASSQSTNDTIQLKASLAKAVYFFGYDIDRAFSRRCGSILGIKVSPKLTKEVTHIIFSVEAGMSVPIDKTYIHGMATGALMISKEWVTYSLEAKQLLDPRKFEIPANFFPNCALSASALNDDGVKRSRENREFKNPGLLQGISIHVFKSTSWPTNSQLKSQTAEGFRMNKKELQDLIKLAGGNVINREPDPENVDPFDMPPRFHAEKDPMFAIIGHITLYDESNEPPAKHSLEHVKSLKVDWLVHSIIQFKLLNPEPYY